MIKKRVVLAIALIFSYLGYYIAGHQILPGQTSSAKVQFVNQNIASSDILTLSVLGNIYQISQNSVKQVTQNQDIIEPSPFESGFIAINRQTNYSSLVEFDQSGNLTQTLFNGNTGDIDTMRWITDPSVNQQTGKIAYVSDEGKEQTGLPDNALYVLNSDGQAVNVAKPDPYSGGLAHPVWDPINPSILYYDYYQYDQSLNPYSTIMEYDSDTGTATPITATKQDAFQESISPDGKQIIFLTRTSDELQVNLEYAAITQSGLAKIHTLATGDYAYPVFSNTQGYIYFMQATANSGYNLFSALIKENKLINILPITSGAQLLGNSSYDVNRG